MWKNKHVVIAMIVAPILAVLAWFAVGALVGEKAQVAKPGGAYPDSEFPLAQATFGLLSGGNEVVADAEHDASPDAAAQMTVTIPAFADPEAMLRVAVKVQESLYFAEVPVVFMRPEEPRLTR
jgi:hypothetical protein